jgi:hypothetical protein
VPCTPFNPFISTALIKKKVKKFIKAKIKNRNPLTPSAKHECQWATFQETYVCSTSSCDEIFCLISYKSGQDTQRTYNVILRRVHVTTVVVEQQKALRIVSVYSCLVIRVTEPHYIIVYGPTLDGIASSNPAHGKAVFSCECLCRQVEVSATGRSLVQRSPTDRGVLRCELGTSWIWRPSPALGCRAREQKLCHLRPVWL